MTGRTSSRMVLVRCSVPALNVRCVVSSPVFRAFVRSIAPAAEQANCARAACVWRRFAIATRQWQASSLYAWRPRQPVTLLSAQWQRRPAAGTDSCCVPCQCHRSCIACASVAHARRHEHLAVGSQVHESKVPQCKEDQSGQALAHEEEYAQRVRPPLPQNFSHFWQK